MKKILVVDDEAGFTRLLKLNLERTGRFKVRIVNDSTQAIEALRVFKPDLALLDIVMPDVDGGDLVAQMKADAQLNRIPILMLTALVSPSELSPGAVAQSGDLTMIAKPVNMETLLRAIEEKFAVVR
jgi:two-component system, OmpR family, response regulator